MSFHKRASPGQTLASTSVGLVALSLASVAVLSTWSARWLPSLDGGPAPPRFNACLTAALIAIASLAACKQQVGRCRVTYSDRTLVAAILLLLMWFQRYWALWSLLPASRPSCGYPPPSPEELLVDVGIGPFAEELVFRGTLLFGIRRLTSDWTACVLSASLFALYHYWYGDPLQMLETGLFGFLLAAITVRVRSVVPAMALHSVENATFYLREWVFAFAPC